VELTGSGAPQFPPPRIDLCQQGSLARLGVAGADRRKDHWGGALPDITIYPGGLGGIVTPLMPAVAPVLAVLVDAGGDLKLRLNQEGV
jgi:hypothetical protein